MNLLTMTGNYDKKVLHKQISSFVDQAEKSANTTLGYKNLNKVDKLILSFDVFSLISIISTNPESENWFSDNKPNLNLTTEKAFIQTVFSVFMAVSHFELFFSIKQIGNRLLKLRESISTTNEVTRFISEMKSYQAKDLNEVDKTLVEDALKIAEIQQRLADRTKWLAAEMIGKYALRTVTNGLISIDMWTDTSMNGALIYSSSLRRSIKYLLLLVVHKNLHLNDTDAEFLKRTSTILKRSISKV